MKLECSKKSLLNAINIVSKAVSTRSTLPILNCILLTGDREGFRLLASDRELSIETDNIESDLYEKGSVAIDAKMFADIIKALPTEMVTLTVDEKNVCHIKSGKSEFTINGQPAEQFPEVPVVNKRENIVLKSADIKNMIKQTIFSVATDESKPILTGELFKFDENCFNAVAIDGFRVSWRKTVCEYDGYTEMVVPSKTLNELARLLSDDENEKATIYYSSSYILFEIKGCTIVSRLLDGEFLNYENLFVENSPVKLTANTHELLSAFERATIVSEDNKKTPVILTIKENNLNIRTTTDRGLVNEDVPITLDGEELVIHVQVLVHRFHHPLGVVGVVDGKAAGVADLLRPAAQDAHTGRVEGGGKHLVALFPAQHPAQALLHLPGRLVGEGDGHHVPAAHGVLPQHAVQPAGRGGAGHDGTAQGLDVLFGGGAGQLF